MGRTLKTTLLCLLTIVVTGLSYCVILGADSHTPDPRVNTEIPRALPTLPIKEIRAFADVYSNIKRYYVEPVSDEKIINSAIKGMIQALDPHSAFLDKKAYLDLRENIRGEFGGIGIEIMLTKEGFLKIISVLPQTPAFRARLHSGDLIVKIDATFVHGLPLSEAVQKLRGKNDTVVVLTVARKNRPLPLVVSITRQNIKIDNVHAKIAAPGYLWLRINQFQETVVADIIKQLKALPAQNLCGIVLDLRDNPGGLLGAAIDVSSLFLNKNSLVVYTQGRDKTSKEMFYAHVIPNQSAENALLYTNLQTLPMILLVNGGSASASEIVTGALQDNKRAIIMGTKTFGKGSVQTTFEIASSKNTAIKITTARYYTPSGRSIQATGIIPDVVIHSRTDDNQWTLREANLNQHLTNQQQLTVHPDSKNDDSNQSIPIEYGSMQDVNLYRAINILKAVHIVLLKMPIKIPTLVKGEDSGNAKNSGH